jgi:hypothetical protein
MDTVNMETADILAACEAAVPGVPLDQVVETLRQVAAEQFREADRLQALK